MNPETKPKRIVIKIGSSSLTSRHGEMSQKKLEKLSNEIVLLKDAGYEVVVVSSGAVAAGYRKLGCLERPTSLPEKQAAAAIGQGLLMEAYSKLFMSNGYVTSQILITRSDFLDESRYKNVRNTLNILIERGVIPIVNENDTVTVDDLKFGDNDTLSAKVAGMLDADQLLILSDIDGLYDANPLYNQNAKLIESVYEITPEIELMAGGSDSLLGTGGMKSKIEAVKIALASGIPTFLGNANKTNIVENALIGRATGTYFSVKEAHTYLNHKKRWIAFHSLPEGSITISQAAEEQIVNRNQGLTPVGILDITGQFERGAVISIVDVEGNKVGCGVINFSSDELRLFVTTKSNFSNVSPFVMNDQNIVCHKEVPITM